MDLKSMVCCRKAISVKNYGFLGMGYGLKEHGLLQEGEVHKKTSVF